jgi:hypothetical protein
MQKQELANQQLRNRIVELESELRRYKALARAVQEGNGALVRDILTDLSSVLYKSRLRRTFTPEFKRAFLSLVSRRPDMLDSYLREYDVSLGSYRLWVKKAQARKARREKRKPSTIAAPTSRRSFEVLED